MRDAGRVLDTPNSRPVGALSLVRGELRVTNHHTDPGTPCYGQQRAEEVLACKMSGWLTNKFVCTEKLRGFACATHQAFSLGISLGSGVVISQGSGIVPGRGSE